MYGPPSDSRHRPAPDQPTWRGLLASYVLVAAVPLSLWVIERPLVRAVAIAAVVGLLVGAHRVSRLAWCLHVCRELTVDLAGVVRITITRMPTDDPS